MMIQVVSEYDIDPDEVIVEYPDFWKDYQRWSGEDKEGFVLMMITNLYDDVMQDRQPDYQQVDYV